MSSTQVVLLLPLKFVLFRLLLDHFFRSEGCLISEKLCDKRIECCEGNVTGNKQILNNTALMAFCFWIAANVEARELAEDTGAEKQNDYFFSSSMVLLRKKNTSLQLIYVDDEPWQCSFSVYFNTEHFNSPRRTFSFFSFLQPSR